MIGLIQRVSTASVEVGGKTVGSIGTGLLVLVGVEQGDGADQAERLAERLLSYRVFPDEKDRMNLNISQISGSLLLVPQFTLAADTEQGNRPGFSKAADPATGKRLFEHLVQQLQQSELTVETGMFGANMSVRLCNEGPVTFSLRVSPA